MACRTEAGEMGHGKILYGNVNSNSKDLILMFL
jgi:hypothetical protein